MYKFIFSVLIFSILVSCAQGTDNSTYSINIDFSNNSEQRYTIDINKDSDIVNAELGDIMTDLVLQPNSSLIVPYTWKPGKYINDFNMYGNQLHPATAAFQINIETHCPELNVSCTKTVGIDMKGNDIVKLKAFFSVLKLSYTKSEWDTLLAKIAVPEDRASVISCVNEYTTYTSLNENSFDLESDLNTIVKPILIKYQIPFESKLILQRFY